MNSALVHKLYLTQQLRDNTDRPACLEFGLKKKALEKL